MAHLLLGESPGLRVGIKRGLSLRFAIRATFGLGRIRVTENVREHLERILGSYEDINRRFTEVGGIAKLLGLFEDVKRELERVSDQELERVTGEIKSVVEDLLKVDYELRKVQNLKLLFEQRRESSAGPVDET